MSEILEQDSVASFNSVEDLREVLEAKSKFKPVDWYPRRWQ